MPLLWDLFGANGNIQSFRNLDPQLKIKLQRLETQKRAALDSEAGKIFELKLFPASRPLRNT